MNYLAIAQMARKEAKISGSGTPTTVVGQAGQLLSVCDWVASAWKDIQRRHANWKWMRVGFTLPTVNNVDYYAYTAATDVLTAAPIARFSRWWWDDPIDSLLCYLQSGGVAGQYRLIPISWARFKQKYRFGVQQSTTGQPIEVSVDDQMNLVLGPKPNGVYVVSGYFQRGVQTLAVDADTPDMPADYHDLIAYRAIEKYGASEVAPEVFARAQLEGGRVMRALELNQWPGFSMGGPLA